ncbi:MAG: hypothetical protein J2P25_06785 [Nocardiopsaceae bacterium]|nr:hypothetical protein [Nocardiopsaceae bacterium]
MTPEERRDDAEARFWCAVEEPAPEAERLEAAELLDRVLQAEAETGADTGYPEWSPEENAQAEAEWEAYQREPDELYVPDGMPAAGQLADDEANRTGFRYPDAEAEADRPGGYGGPQAEP